MLSEFCLDWILVRALPPDFSIKSRSPTKSILQRTRSPHFLPDYARSYFQNKNNWADLQHLPHVLQCFSPCFLLSGEPTAVPVGFFWPTLGTTSDTVHLQSREGGAIAGGLLLLTISKGTTRPWHEVLEGCFSETKWLIFSRWAASKTPKQES